MKRTIELDGLPVEVTWRNNMTKIRLRVCIPHGEVKISAPTGVPMQKIRDTFLPKITRIKKMVVDTREKMKDKRRAYRDGEQFQLLGDSYILKTKLVEKSSKLPYIEHKKLIMEQFADEALETTEKRLKLFYRNHLARLANPMLDKWSKIIGVRFHKVTYKHMRTRWGSCSSRGHISLNVSLGKLPIELIEYVVVHELCHLIEPNHSSRFYALVNKHLPNSEEKDHQIKHMDPLF